jgi:hypothetical protein
MTNGSGDNTIKLDDFLNPKSMITPGAAGGITMMITNTLASQFSGLPGNWTALTLSFMFGALTFMYAAHVLNRIIFFVINSLIIFVMAQGSNTLGLSVRQASATPSAQFSAAPAHSDGGGSSFTTAAAPSGQTASADPAAPAPTSRTGDSRVAQTTTGTKQTTSTSTSTSTSTTTSTDKKDGFFRPWGWTGDKKP